MKKKFIFENRIKMNMPIPDEIKLISNIFKKNGYQLFVVGGAVRDFLSKSKIKDYDLATNATPDEVINLAKKYNLHVVDEFKHYGRVDVNGNEVVTFRKDIGSERKLDSIELSTIEEDVSRRDFTINALFYDLDTNEIVDLVGGVEDLKNNIIRTVGNPTDRFNEDQIRKLRAFRFLGSIDGTMDKETYQALKDNPSLSKVSPEKIKGEFIKGLEKSKSVKKYLDSLYDLDFMNQIFPGIDISNDYPEESNYIILVAFFLKEKNPNEIEKYLKNLKYTNDEIKKIEFLVSLYNFELDDLLKLKKKQKIYGIPDSDVIKFGEYVGKDFKKFVKFQPTVTIEDVPKDLFYQERGKWILNKEIENFNSMNENRLLLKNMLKKVILENLKK